MPRDATLGSRQSSSRCQSSNVRSGDKREGGGGGGSYGKKNYGGKYVEDDASLYGKEHVLKELVVNSIFGFNDAS